MHKTCQANETMGKICQNQSSVSSVEGPSPRSTWSTNIIYASPGCREPYVSRMLQLPLKFTSDITSDRGERCEVNFGKLNTSVDRTERCLVYIIGKSSVIINAISARSKGQNSQTFLT